MIDCAPQVMFLSSDLHEQLVQMPLPLRHLTHCFSYPFTDLTEKMAFKPFAPETDAFVANINAALTQQVFDIPQ